MTANIDISLECTETQCGVIREMGVISHFSGDAIPFKVLIASLASPMCLGMLSLNTKV